MKLSELQEAVYSYSTKNPVLLVLLQFSKIVALIYPIYILLCRFSFLSAITSIVGCVSTILYISHYIGMILCFAKKDMLTIAIVFALKSLVDLIWIIQYSISFNDITGVILYAALAWLAFSKTSYSVKKS